MTMKKIIIALFCFVCASAGAETIADQLTALHTIKSDIKAALEAKGQTPGDIFAQYDEAISAISGGGGWNYTGSYPQIIGTVATLTYASNASAGQLISIRGIPPWTPELFLASAYGTAGKAPSSAISHNSSAAAFGTDGGTPAYLRTYRWSEASGTYLLTNPASSLPGGISWSIDFDDSGNYMCVGSADGKVRCYTWDDATNRYALATAPNSDTCAGNYVTAMSGNKAALFSQISSGNYGQTYRWSDANSRFELTAALGTAAPGGPRSAEFSGDGTILALVGESSPYIRVYEWSAASNAYNLMASQPDILPSAAAYAVSISNDAAYMAVGYNASPYIINYKLLNGRYVKMPVITGGNPAGAVWAAGLSGAGNALAVSFPGSPYFYVYELLENDNQYVRVQVPTAAPAGYGYTRVGISGDGRKILAPSYTSSATPASFYQMKTDFSGFFAYSTVQAASPQLWYLGFPTTDVMASGTAFTNLIWRGTASFSEGFED